MAEQAFPFDGAALVYEDGWRRMARQWLGTGVLANVPGLLEVTAPGTGMTVTVAAGAAWIEGFYYENDADIVRPITAAVSNQARVDRVVLHLDTAANTIDVRVVAGVPVSPPGVAVGKPLVQTPTVWEHLLAEVVVGTAVGVIRPQDVANARLYAAARSAAVGALGLPITRTHNFPANNTYLTARTLIGAGGTNPTNGGYLALVRTAMLDPNRLYRVECTVTVIDGDGGSGLVNNSAAILALHFRAGASTPLPTDQEFASRQVPVTSDDSTRAMGGAVVGYLNGVSDGSYRVTTAGLYTVGAFLASRSSGIGVRTSGYQTLDVRDIGARVTA